MKPHMFTPFPILNTTRLKLRSLQREDAEALFNIRQDPSYHQYTDTLPDETVEVTMGYIDKMNRGVADNRWLVWAIESLEDNELLGAISLWQFDESSASAELGYGIKGEAQKKGFMQEALRAVVDYGFHTLDLEFVDAYTDIGHTASEKLLNRSGFVKVGQVDDQGYLKERIFQMAVYRRTRKNGNNSLLDK